MLFAISCIVDAKPKFEYQAWLWAISLTMATNQKSGSLYVHTLPGVSHGFRVAMERLGVNIVQTQPFDGHPYCNKIQQCFTSELYRFDKVILTDCDLFFLQWPEPADFSGVIAKIADLPNPPLGVLQTLFKEANLPLPTIVPVDFQTRSSECTIATNFNGGFYQLPGNRLHELGEDWRQSARWCLERVEKFRPYSNHVDQIAMSLSIARLGLPTKPLSTEDNCPTHLGSKVLGTKQKLDPRILHYHDRIDKQGFLNKSGAPNIDRNIERANTIIAESRRTFFDNGLFWNFRYCAHPDLGSGVGSRARVATYKRKLIRDIVAIARSSSILDVGCGDVDVLRGLRLPNYLGIDISREAIEIAEKNLPQLNFQIADFLNEDVPNADLVICFDVLIHQPTFSGYQKFVDKLINSARRHLVIGAYNEQPRLRSSITFYYEPISKSLVQRKDVKSVRIIGGYRDIVVICASLEDDTIEWPVVGSNDIWTIMKELATSAPLRFPLLGAFARRAESRRLVGMLKRGRNQD